MLNFLPLFKTSSFISTIPLQLLLLSLCFVFFFFFFYCQISSLVELMSIFPYLNCSSLASPTPPFTPHHSFEIVQFHVTNLVDIFSLLNHSHVPFLLCSMIHLKCIHSAPFLLPRAPQTKLPLSDSWTATVVRQHHHFPQSVHHYNQNVTKHH